MVKTTVGQYILNRLKEIGIDTIFGVPGDYNMVNMTSALLFYIV